MTPREGKTHRNLNTSFSVFPQPPEPPTVSPLLKNNHVLGLRRAMRESEKEPAVPGAPMLGLFKQLCSLHLTLWPPGSSLSWMEAKAHLRESNSAKKEVRRRTGAREAAGWQACASPPVSASDVSLCCPLEKGKGTTLQSPGAMVGQQERQAVAPHRASSTADVGDCVHLALEPP